MKKGDKGADYAHARPPVAWLKAKGITFVCRYVLDDGRNAGKALHKAEAQALSAAGITVCANFEFATRPNGTFSQGTTDAHVALSELVRIGAPRHIVYFSFDYDVQPGDLAGCLAYMNGAASVLGKGSVGAYGNFRLIEYLGRNGFVWGWQCYAWSYGQWSNYATVRQTRNGAWPGEYDADLNVAMADDIGGWILGRDYTPEDEDMDAKSALTVQPGMPNLVERGTKVGETLTLEQSILGIYEHVFELEEILKAQGLALTDLRGQFRGFVGDEQQDDAKVTQALAEIKAAQASGNGIDVGQLALQISGVLLPEQRKTLAELLSKTHLAVDPS